MNVKKATGHDKDSPAANTQAEQCELHYEPAADVDPLELIGNAHLALHHHMAPADGGFDLETDEDDG